MDIKITITPGLTEKFTTLLELLAHRSTLCRRPMKAIAADMDVSPSDLSRKLRHNPGDPRSFSVEDLDRWITATGDLSPLHWLIEKHIALARDAREELLDRLASRYDELADLAGLVSELKAAATKGSKRAR